jgi:uncharacterized hydrophobic protein (TIGR00271 family)
MKIAGFIPAPENAESVISWTQSFKTDEDEIELLCYESWFGSNTEQSVKEVLDDQSQDISITIINDQLAVKAVEGHLRKEKTDLLVTCYFALPEIDGVDQDAFVLANDAPCKTFLVMHGERTPEQIKTVMFFSSGYVHDSTTIKLLSDLGEKFEWKITVATVEEETGAKAGQTGEQMLRSLIHDAGLDPENFEIKVAVDRMVLAGVRESYDDHDMIIAGIDSERYFRVFEKAFPNVFAALVKRNPPLRLKSIIEWLPKINPSDHADLIHELKQGSVWGPDFIVMLGLAAAVSSLGLIQDSPAVVIGSMLLAPLMTPMMGLGLALAQANRDLMWMSLKSIVFGFFLTVVISYLIGFVTPSGETLSQEVLSRGSPNVLDLMIALFAACAAAFAMARPNIAGAIAGVAIATALVPPACSIGISFAHGDLWNGLGASLLFFTNLVAIIAASSFVFTFLGISTGQSLRRHRRLALASRVGLVVVLLALFAPMSIKLLEKINEGKNVPVAYPVTRAVAAAVNEKVDQDEDIEVMLMARGRSDPGIVIHLASERNLPRSYGDEIIEIVRREMNDPKIPVSVTAVKSIWLQDEKKNE